jgi:hypothetical protein
MSISERPSWLIFEIDEVNWCLAIGGPVAYPEKYEH